MKPVTQRVAGSFLYREGRYLLLHRTQRVKTYGGYWCCISGKSDPRERIDRTVVREIEEETGIAEQQLRLLGRGATFPVDTGLWRRRITPFLFAIDPNVKIRLNYEHSAIRWVAPWGLSKYHTVPCIQDMLLGGGLPVEGLQAVDALGTLSAGPDDGLHPDMVRRLEKLAVAWSAIEICELRRRLELTAWGMAGDLAGTENARLQIVDIYESCVRDKINRLKK